MPRRRDDRSDHDDLTVAASPRHVRREMAEADDVLGLDAASDDGPDAHGLFDSPGDVVQFGENLLTATGRGFSTFGDNVVTAIEAGVKEFIADGANAVSNLAGRGQGDDDDAADNQDGGDDGGGGDGGGGSGGGGDGGDAQSGSTTVEVDLDLDVAGELTSATEFASADLDPSDDLDGIDDGFLAD